MGSEEGEIYEPPSSSYPASVSAASISYDTSYEWPGESSNTPFHSPHSYQTQTKPAPANALRPNQPTFRLVVLSSSILPQKHRLAVIDGYSEIQFGRDVAPAGSTMPKIRLKEMEVSKVHATAYWDASRKEWGVVDMGSVHGTFLLSASAATAGNDTDRGVRLSPPRQASIPRKMGHFDRLTIGGTTFLVHMHEDRLPCEECWTSGTDEIPLCPISKSAKTSAAPKSLDVTPPSGYTPKPAKDPRKSLTMLKQSLLTRHGDSNLRSKSTPPGAAELVAQYVDRSARRRALMPASHPDAPGVSASSASTGAWAEPPPPPPPPRPKSPVVEPISQPPTPLTASNVGHRLLMKQGWEPGTALGPPLDPEEGRIGLVEPIEVSASVNRGGLGLKRSLTTMSMPTLSDPDWKASAKRRRWEEA